MERVTAPYHFGGGGHRNAKKLRDDNNYGECLDPVGISIGERAAVDCAGCGGRFQNSQIILRAQRKTPQAQIDRAMGIPNDDDWLLG
jgi:hypothetical protein